MSFNTNCRGEHSIANEKVSKLEDYFSPFRENIIGKNQEFESQYGIKE